MSTISFIYKIFWVRNFTGDITHLPYPPFDTLDFTYHYGKKDLNAQKFLVNRFKTKYQDEKLIIKGNLITDNSRNTIDISTEILSNHKLHLN